jgi:HAD superfamily hydrolase (TIGR01549 family)
MIEVIYLDLGKVIIDFDYSVATREIMKVTRVSPDEIAHVLCDGSLILEYETGKISSAEHYQKVCCRLQMNISMEQFQQLWGSMFLPEPLLSESLLKKLRQRYRLILLSNTNEIHFDYVLKKYPILQHVEERLLSYQLGCMKPEPRIFQMAIERAGVLPEQIFFADDRTENIEAARQAGIQAYRFQSEEQLRRDMLHAGIQVDMQ